MASVRRGRSETTESHYCQKIQRKLIALVKRLLYFIVYLQNVFLLSRDYHVGSSSLNDFASCFFRSYFFSCQLIFSVLKLCVYKIKNNGHNNNNTIQMHD